MMTMLMVMLIADVCRGLCWKNEVTIYYRQAAWKKILIPCDKIATSKLQK